MELRRVKRRKLKPLPVKRKRPALMPSAAPPSVEVETITVDGVAIERAKVPAPPAPPPIANSLPLRFEAMEAEIEPGDEHNEFGQPPPAKRWAPKRVIKEMPADFKAPEGWTYKVPPRLHRTRALKVRTRGYKPCLCGCGAPCTDYFAKGHYSRWRQMLVRFESGELLPHRVLPANLFERLGPWVRTEQGGLKATKTYKALRR